MFAALVVAFLAAPQEKQKELPEAAKKELKALEGKWQIVKFGSSMGESEPDPSRPAMYLVFKGGELTMGSGDKKETLKVAAIDPTTDPKCIDLLEKRDGKPDRNVEGVYKIDKDTLRFAMCVPTADGKQRPAGFDKPTDARTVVFTLKRVKD